MGEWSELKELLEKFVPASLSVFGNAALTAILYGFQYVVEKNSPCPCDPKWNTTHSDLAFSVPTVVLFLISMIVVPDSRRMFKCGTCRRCPECGRCSGCSQCGKCSGCSQCGICSVVFQCVTCVRRFVSETCCNCSNRSCDSQCQSNCGCCWCWNTFSQVCFVLNTLAKISIPSVIWVVILLLDGDYYACYFAPSVNRTHGNQTCKEFCSLESSSSLREHCFWSRILGSILLCISAALLTLLKFLPRWTYCDCTEEGYYKFKYVQVLEKKKWNKMKEELRNTAEETAKMEAKDLVPKLKLRKSNQSEQSCNQGEQNPNQGEQSSNQGEQSSNQGEQNPNQGEQISNQTIDTNIDEAGPSENSA